MNFGCSPSGSMLGQKTIRPNLNRFLLATSLRRGSATLVIPADRCSFNSSCQTYGTRQITDRRIPSCEIEERDSVLVRKRIVKR